MDKKEADSRSMARRMSSNGPMGCLECIADNGNHLCSTFDCSEPGAVEEEGARGKEAQSQEVNCMHDSNQQGKASVQDKATPLGDVADRVTVPFAVHPPHTTGSTLA